MFDIPHQLSHGHVISLYPRQDGALRVISGRLYVTTNQSPEDYFLEAGEELYLNADTHVVIETWNQDRMGAAVFAWQSADAAEPIFQHLQDHEQTSAALQ
jgi:hypothetical protein